MQAEKTGLARKNRFGAVHFSSMRSLLFILVFTGFAIREHGGVQINTQTSVHISGAPPSTKVPMTVFFHTSSLDSYSSSVSSKVRIEATTGFDFSSFQLGDILDANDLPKITFGDAVSSTAIELVFLEEPLKGDTSYEFSLLVKTGSSGSTMSAVVVSWYSRTATSNPWIEQEKSSVNQGRGSFPGQLQNMVNTQVKSSQGTLIGSMVGAWESAPDFATFLLDLRMSQVLNGIVSIMLFPPSLWNLDAKGGGLIDGQSCPDGIVNAVPGQTFGVIVPTNVSQCSVRKKGHHVDSVELWFVMADVSLGTSVMLSLPKPQAGMCGSWYVSYREFGSAPGFSLLTVPITTAAQQILKPNPYARILSVSSTSPDHNAILKIEFKAGSDLIYRSNSRIEFRFSSTVFSVDSDGCDFALEDKAPIGSFLRTRASDNSCELTWGPVVLVGAGEVQISSSGGSDGWATRFSGSVDFLAMSVIGAGDPENTNGYLWHYLVAGGHKLIVKRSSTDSATGETVEILATDMNTLQGTNTHFRFGTTGQIVSVGDVVVAGGRTFLVTNVIDDLRCSVTESGVAPSTSLTSTAFRVKWKEKLQVTSFDEVSTVPTVSQATYTVERFTEGLALWSSTYSLTVYGKNAFIPANTQASDFHEIRIYSGRYSGSSLDAWTTDFAGDAYTIAPTRLITEAAIYPTTVAAGSKARVLLTFTTGTSSHFSGGSDESSTAGMVLRLRSNLTTAWTVHDVDGIDLSNAAAEDWKTLCSLLFLEAWSEATDGFPSPSYCWWDSWLDDNPSIYMKFEVGNGLRMRTRYQLVFLASFKQTANWISSLLQIDMIDGDGTTIINTGFAGITKTILPQSIEGFTEEPILTSVEILNGEPLVDGKLQLRLRGGSLATNYLGPYQKIRLFFYPLTAWNIPDGTCIVMRSDGVAGDTACDTIRGDRNTFTLQLTLDQNAISLSNVSNTIFSFTGVPTPVGGLFRGEIGAEAYGNPRNTFRFVASYTSSAEGRRGSDNFLSSPVAGGSGYISHYETYTTYASNTVTILYRPAAICFSRGVNPCRLVVTAPLGFTVVSADALNTTNSSSSINTTSGRLQLAQDPICDTLTRTCTLEIARSFALWAGSEYGLQIKVLNPQLPMSKISAANTWSVQLSGSNGWNFGEREYAMVATLEKDGMHSTFAVRGELRMAAVLPGSLLCGGSTYFRVQFITTQHVPLNGMMKVHTPAGFTFDVTASNQCQVQPLVNWPSSVTCDVVNGQAVAVSIATLTIAAGLEGGMFYAFEVPGKWPSSISSYSDFYFTLETFSAETELDIAERVTWSPQAHMNGALLFPTMLECYSHGVDYLNVELDDMRPFAVTAASTIARIAFRWDTYDVSDSPLEVQIIAPPGYKWDVQANGQGFNVTSTALVVETPLMLYPSRSVDVTRADSNVLYLMSTEYFEQKVMYGFSAKIRVPSATPGTSDNGVGGNAWYVLFGSGNTQHWAAERANFIEPDVRAIYGFTVQSSTNVPMEIAAVTARFSTVTALPAGGILQISLPPGFSCGQHLGQTCAVDRLMAVIVEPSAVALPSNMPVTCTTMPSGSVFRWSAGGSGLPFGHYAVTIFVKNADAVLDSGRLPGNFEVHTFLDSGRTTIADKMASFAASIPAQSLPQAQLVTSYIDSSIFDVRPSHQTWVVFAFELGEAISADSLITLTGPHGFQFDTTCQAHLGDGSSYSPLGDSSTNAPSYAPQYILFPPHSNATCSSDVLHQNVAKIKIVSVLENWASLPAVRGSLYLFRVMVTNPAAVPSLNEWSITVDNQESEKISGYDLAEFWAPSVTPTNLATDQNNTITIKFQNLNVVPGIQFTTDHGIVLVEMPMGFELMTVGLDSTAVDCVDFLGLYNNTIHGLVLVSGVQCEGLVDNRRLIILRVRRQGDLPPGRYEFACRIRNSAYPLEAYSWQIRSYTRNSATTQYLLDSSSISGFPLNLDLRSFSVKPSPSGKQSSGKNATLLFKAELMYAIASGDILLVQGPTEYSFEASTGSCAEFHSNLLPAPQCTGNIARFSFVGFEDDLVPSMNPFGKESSTVVNFKFLVTNPPTKPVENFIQFVHCQLADANTANSSSGLCPSGWRVLASGQQHMWEIVPQLISLSIVLLPPRVYAQGEASLFKVVFTAASPGATSLRIHSVGMNFTGCIAEHDGVQDACAGVYEHTTVTLQAGQIPSDSVFELEVRRVTNPIKVGATVWTITTYDGDGGAVDETVGHVGYLVSGYLSMQPVVDCQAAMLLDPNIPTSSKSSCASDNPWYEYEGNGVTLHFNALASNPDMLLGGTGGNGYYLLIYAPPGYRLWRGGVPFQGLTGFPSDDGYVIAPPSLFNDTTSTQAEFSDEVLGIKLLAGLPQEATFSLKVFVDNPALDVTRNLWKVVLWDIGAQDTLYTNDGDWTGFTLKGTFLNAGTQTKVQWLVSDFPSETNVVRLSIALASPLRGQSLLLKVTAPDGFMFDAVCLPTDPDVRPLPTIAVRNAWVSSCAATRTKRHEAMITLAYELEKAVEYAANLLVTNAPTYQDTATWELYTYANNDALNFVHFAKLQPFVIQVMQATVFPDMKKYGESGFLHVSFLPLRDLGPFGEVLLTAPEGFSLFCTLRPFFDHGNMPSGVSCSGTNTFAIVKLSGSGFLERGINYYFSLRVTNPTESMFTRYHGSSPLVSATSLRWGVRLQTQDRDLVHETTQITGWLPTLKAITRFSVIPSSQFAGQQADLRVQFKLETAMLRWRTNYLELVAPIGFSFACANEFVDNKYVLPSNAILSANIKRFDNLNVLLEVPPTMGIEIYRNDGTTEDGRSIVDCSQPGKIGLALDHTDSNNYGRYAFKVVVNNGIMTPVRNVWTLSSFSDSELVEEGITAGYDVANATQTPPPTDTANRRLSRAYPVILAFCLCSIQQLALH